MARLEKNKAKYLPNILYVKAPTNHELKKLMFEPEKNSLSVCFSFTLYPPHAPFQLSPPDIMHMCKYLTQLDIKVRRYTWLSFYEI